MLKKIWLPGTKIKVTEILFLKNEESKKYKISIIFSFDN